MRCSPRSNCSRRSGRRTAPSPSRDSRATRPRPPTTTRRSCAKRPACSTASSRSAPATCCRAPGTSRRSPSPASTPPASGTPRTPSCRACGCASARASRRARTRATYFEALEAHLLEHVPHGAQLQIEDLDLGQPFLVDTSGWAAADALDAMHEAFGKKAVLMGSGGSIPFIADLVERYPAAQILITGVEDPDARAHSPNESLHLPTFQHAILAEALLLARLECTRRGPARRIGDMTDTTISPEVVDQSPTRHARGRADRRPPPTRCAACSSRRAATTCVCASPCSRADAPV